MLAIEDVKKKQQIIFFCNWSAAKYFTLIYKIYIYHFSPQYLNVVTSYKKLHYKTQLIIIKKSKLVLNCLCNLYICTSVQLNLLIYNDNKYFVQLKKLNQIRIYVVNCKSLE